MHAGSTAALCNAVPTLGGQPSFSLNVGLQLIGLNLAYWAPPASPILRTTDFSVTCSAIDSSLLLNNITLGLTLECIPQLKHNVNFLAVPPDLGPT